MKQPYDWQNSAVMRFARAAYFALVVDCGCGKTLAAIMLAVKKNLPTIVIAPTHNLCDQWRTDILEQIPDASVWVHSKPKETKDKTYQRRFEEWLIS